jgi:hypothetical protein
MTLQSLWKSRQQQCSGCDGDGGDGGDEDDEDDESAYPPHHHDHGNHHHRRRRRYPARQQQQQHDGGGRNGGCFLAKLLSSILVRILQRRSMLLLWVCLTYLSVLLWTSNQPEHHYRHRQPMMMVGEDFIKKQQKYNTTTTTGTIPTTTTTTTATSHHGSYSNNNDNHEHDPQRQDYHPYIRYQLYANRPYRLTFGPYTQCPLGITYNKWGKKPLQRVPLPDPLQDIMNMTTFLQTNLKLLTVGDSVGMQFHQILEEAVVSSTMMMMSKMDANDNAYDTTTNTTTQLQKSYQRTVYQNAWGDHESVSILTTRTSTTNTTPTTTMVVAGFRMTGWLLKSGQDQPPPNAGPHPRTGAGGWTLQHIQQLLQHEYNVTTNTALHTPPLTAMQHHQNVSDTVTTAIPKTKLVVVDKFDVMLFRIPHGWLSLNVITESKLQEALLLAHTLFGVHTVIIHTLFFNVCIL